MIFRRFFPLGLVLSSVACTLGAPDDADSGHSMQNDPVPSETGGFGPAAGGSPVSTDSTDAPEVGTGEGVSTDTGGQPGETDCAKLLPPTLNLLTWLHAEDLTVAEGSAVSSWTSRSGGADFGAGEASYGAASDGKSATVRFDGAGDRLHSSIPISGLDSATFALVSRTTELKLAPHDWCQGFNMAISENGCSGTFTTALMWDEEGAWGFTFLGPVQEQVSFRFGTGNKTYGDLEDPAIQALMYDPNVAWRRPVSIEDALTSTVLQKDGAQMRLYVDGQLVLEQGVPGGPGVMKNMHDSVWLGGGRGDFHWAGEIAEVLVYGGKLSSDETDQLNRYLVCEHPEVAGN